MVNVTQADRDLAVRIFKKIRTRGIVYAENMKQGYVDGDFMFQAIAAHRIATIEECAKVAAVWSPDAEYDIMALKGPTNDQEGKTLAELEDEASRAAEEYAEELVLGEAVRLLRRSLRMLEPGKSLLFDEIQKLLGCDFIENRHPAANGANQ